MLLQRFAILVVTLCTLASNAAMAVVHGEALEDSEAPYVVKLVSLDAKGHVYESCTGTFITSSWVLTAGHCVADGKPLCFDSNTNKAFKKPICSSELKTNFVYSAEEADKEDGKTLDLGLVHFPEGTSAQAAPSSNSQAVSVGDSASFIGYGIMEESFTDSGALFTDGPEVVHKNTGLSKIDSIDPSFYYLFQQEIGTFADEGDSGAPLFVKGKMVGVLITAYRDDHVNTGIVQGDLYGVYNQAVRLDSTAAKDFLLQQGITLP